MHNGRHILRDVVLTSTDDLHFAHERALSQTARRIPGKKSLFRARTAKKLALPWPWKLPRGCAGSEVAAHSG